MNKKINSSKKFAAANQNNLPLPLTGDLYKENKRRISFAKLTRLLFLSTASFIIIISLFTGAITLYSNTSKAETVSQDSIVSALGKNMILPEDNTLIEVRRISDADNLKTQNDFYKNAKDGDYIIVYQSISILYDYYHNTIKNVVTKNKE
jgi:hypothetical protein